MFGLYYVQRDGREWTVRYSLNGICVYFATSKRDAYRKAEELNRRAE